MNALRTTALLAATVFAPGLATAQQKCPVDLGSPSQVKNAANALGRAQLPVGSPDDKKKQLRSAVQLVTQNADKIGNPAGRNAVLGQALVVWLQQPGAAPVMKRGDVGYTENAEGTIDLVAAADSAFDVLEASNPACTELSEPYRQQVWGELVNRAATAANAQQPDSAEALARRAAIIYDKRPHAFNVLAAISAQRNDTSAAIGYLKQTIAAGTDTADAELRRSAMLSLASLTQSQAEAATGEQKQALSKEAVSLYQAYLKEVPGDANAQAALGRALAASGDTAAAGSLFAEMLKDPARYTDMQLFEAGANAANAKRHDDAVKLFEAGLQKNPHYRDALYNLAITHMALENGDAMIPVVRRLVEVDPSNPDSWRLYAAAYQLKQQKATGAAKKTATDSVVAYLKKADSMPVRVTVDRFGFDGTKQVVGGSIENLSSTAKSYALKLEFLDAAGKPVATETVNVGPVQPKATQRFDLAVATPGIVAYRYAPLD